MKRELVIMQKYSKQPDGSYIVWKKIEFDHIFVVYELATLDKKGRKFHLWNDNQPALGGQWHYTLENAQARAEYILNYSYVSRIEFLEQRVQNLEAEIAQ